MKQTRRILREHAAAVRHAGEEWHAIADRTGHKTRRLFGAVYHAAYEIDDCGLGQRYLRRVPPGDCDFGEIFSALLRSDAQVTCRRTRWKLAAAAQWAHFRQIEPRSVDTFLRNQGGLNACAAMFAQQNVENSWL